MKAINKRLWLRFVCALLACVHFLCFSGRCLLVAQEHGGTGRTAANEPDTGTYLFGISRDSRFGELAWLLYLDRDHGTGQMLVAPRMLKFAACNWGEHGALNFESMEFIGRAYRFIGTFDADVLTGRMQLVDTKTGKAIGDWDLTASPVVPESAAASTTQPGASGRYTNAEYSSEGGDRTGADVRLFSTAGGSAGLIIFYESYWGEPTFTPLALSHISTNKKTVHFDIETASGWVHYSLLLTSTGALLNRDDAPHPQGSHGVPLKRSRSVF